MLLALGSFEFPGNDDRAGGSGAAPGRLRCDGGQVVMPKLARRVYHHLALAVVTHVEDGAAHRLAFAQEPELVIALWRQRLQPTHDQDGHSLLWRTEQMGAGLWRFSRAGQFPERRVR